MKRSAMASKVARRVRPRPCALSPSAGIQIIIHAKGLFIAAPPDACSWAKARCIGVLTEPSGICQCSAIS